VLTAGTAASFGFLVAAGAAALGYIRRMHAGYTDSCPVATDSAASCLRFVHARYGSKFRIHIVCDVTILYKMPFIDN
jgi:hypothetical protein